MILCSARHSADRILEESTLRSYKDQIPLLYPHWNMVRQMRNIYPDRVIPPHICQHRLDRENWDGIAFIPTINYDQSYWSWLDTLQSKCNHALDTHAKRFLKKGSWKINVFSDGRRGLQHVNQRLVSAHCRSQTDTYVRVCFELGGLDILEMKDGYKPHSVHTGTPMPPGKPMEPGGILFILTLLVINGGIRVPMSIKCGGATIDLGDHQERMPHISVTPDPSSEGGIILLNLHDVSSETEYAGMASAALI